MKTQSQKNFYQTTLQTPIAPMIAIADEEALYVLLFDGQTKIKKEYPQGRTKPMDSIERELELYFCGKLQTFKTPIVLVGTDFQKNVWQQLLKIPYGKTQSYVETATAMGKPKAFRALANANAANRLVVVVPCHRVISHDGALGGYTGGLDRKIALLNLEGVNNEAF